MLTRDEIAILREAGLRADEDGVYASVREVREASEEYLNENYRDLDDDERRILVSLNENARRRYIPGLADFCHTLCLKIEDMQTTRTIPCTSRT